ncbi:MAG: DUF1822 family protein [Microcoleus sp. SIO2G3]|nr:DUF1822 family protein [Microcoleus sp. SIO2G3]
MTYSTDELEFALPLPIPQAAFSVADRFAARLPDSKVVQVRLNTIAVCVVENYLQLMGIATDRAASDSWNPIMQLSADIADLQIVNVGRLECRPLLPNTQTCYIPPEVWEDRIGYVAVQVDEAQQQANLLGFVPTASAEELPLSQLQPIESLLDHLDRLLHPASAITVLSQWLQGAIEAGWQTVESLLNPPQLSPAFRGDQAAAGIERGKLIAIGDRAIALTIELTLTPTEIEILLQVHPLDAPTLPPQLQLTILDDEETVFLEARSRQADDYLQLRFSGSAGERFSVQLAIDQISVTEEFMI